MSRCERRLSNWHMREVLQRHPPIIAGLPAPIRRPIGDGIIERCERSDIEMEKAVQYHLATMSVGATPARPRKGELSVVRWHGA
jgi:hypothetical protein